MTAIYKRELKSYMTSMIGYLFIFFVLILTGIYFSAYQLSAAYPKFEYTLSSLTFVFLIGAFYIIVDDSNADLLDLMSRAYKSVRSVKKRPVDILVGTQSKFEERKHRPTLEGEVYQKGVLLYGA